jgi:hypothetical protein
MAANINSSKLKRVAAKPLAPLANTKTWNHHTLFFAQKAIECLIDHGGFVADSKAQFALRMGWTTRGTGGVDEPDRRMVENICNLTRDTAYDPTEWPAAAEALAGYVIAYSPSIGGMTLIDPKGDLTLDHLTHILLGDLQKQKATKTINKRRLPSWKAAGDNAAAGGDLDMARLFWQAENEIKQTGFVSDQVIGQIFSTADSRGLLSTRGAA